MDKWRIIRWGAAAALLLVPLVAMRFTDEVSWTRFDFIVFGAMLVLACGAYEVVLRMTGNKIYRAVIAVAIAAVFLLFWAEGAVGIF